MNVYIDLWVLGIAAVALFCGVVAFGAPFLPAKRSAIEQALDMLNLQPGQTLIDLGSGDGRMLLAAAKRGIHGIGYEINPVLHWLAWVRTVRYRKQVRVVRGNYWRTPLPPADGVFVFLLQPYMKRLDNKLAAEAVRPIRVVSLAFYIPGKKPSAKADGLYLYEYPAT